MSNNLISPHQSEGASKSTLIPTVALKLKEIQIKSTNQETRINQKIVKVKLLVQRMMRRTIKRCKGLMRIKSRVNAQVMRKTQLLVSLNQLKRLSLKVMIRIRIESTEAG